MPNALVVLPYVNRIMHHVTLWDHEITRASDHRNAFHINSLLSRAVPHVFCLFCFTSIKGTHEVKFSNSQLPPRRSNESLYTTASPDFPPSHI